jgi:hypothetical protein
MRQETCRDRLPTFAECALTFKSSPPSKNARPQGFGACPTNCARSAQAFIQPPRRCRRIRRLGKGRREHLRRVSAETESLRWENRISRGFPCSLRCLSYEGRSFEFTVCGRCLAARGLPHAARRLPSRSTEFGGMQRRFTHSEHEFTLCELRFTRVWTSARCAPTCLRAAFWAIRPRWPTIRTTVRGPRAGRRRSRSARTGVRLWSQCERTGNASLRSTRRSERRAAPGLCPFRRTLLPSSGNVRPQ